ncbi:hypothetical protein B8V81_4831 [Paenibacillus pasadenensis]|uniref:Uncharacterized protein n=1 Tax=Paenibacillus pasadenensis TaxID=217090 RepID=A0A2N5N7W8_9BACL|nr:hypothetical protein B8V81_4831 [Paenibacillus pasadenensis]
MVSSGSISSDSASTVILVLLSSFGKLLYEGRWTNMTSGRGKTQKSRSARLRRSIVD